MRMRRNVMTWREAWMPNLAVAASLLSIACIAAQSDAVRVRPSADGRVWQIAATNQVNAKLLWPENANSAQLTVVDRLKAGGVASSYSMMRVSGAEWITVDLPAATGGEALYDLELVFLGESSTVVTTRTARIVRLPDAATVIPAGTRDWERLQAPGMRPIPYDAAWKPETESAQAATMAVTPAGGSATSAALAGTSGWEPFVPRAYGVGGAFDLALAFDGSTAWTASLMFINLGTCIMFR